jgi:hypothetical protein
MSVDETKVTEIMAMGYTREQAIQALRVSLSDERQAVEFLLISDESKRNLLGALNDHEDSFSLREDDAHLGASPSPSSAGQYQGHSHSHAITSTGTGTSPGTGHHNSNNNRNSNNNHNRNHNHSEEQEHNIGEVVQMGYSRQSAFDALRIAHGDVTQAVSFLLMGESRNGFITNEELNDAALAGALQQQRGEPSAATTTTASASASASATSLGRRTSLLHMPANIPKMVATHKSILTYPRGGTPASPFCSCLAASKFLRGGTVHSEFLDDVLQSGVDMMIRETETNGPLDSWGVDLVLQHCGRQFLGITAVIDERKDEPKQGVFLDHDLRHTLGIGKLLATCRNEQTGSNWSVLILETSSSLETFCICLPAKGSSNKFWYFDHKPRTIFRVPGAHARVHASMQLMVESLEHIFSSIAGNEEYQSFAVYTIQKVN